MAALTVVKASEHRTGLIHVKARKLPAVDIGRTQGEQVMPLKVVATPDSVGTGAPKAAGWRKAASQLLEQLGFEGADEFRPGFGLCMDLAESDDRFELSLELPGMRPENVEIVADAGVLAIVGDKSPDRADDGWRYHVRERQFGSFSRAFAMPAEVDLEAITAAMDSGVLKVTLPKRVKDSSRTVGVNRVQANQPVRLTVVTAI